MLQQRDVSPGYLLMMPSTSLSLHRRGKPLGLPRRGEASSRRPPLSEPRHQTSSAIGRGSADCPQRAMRARLSRCARGRSPCRQLAVTEAQLVFREADGFRIVRLFRIPEGAAEQRDGARLVAFRRTRCGRGGRHSVESNAGGKSSRPPRVAAQASPTLARCRHPWSQASASA